MVKQKKSVRNASQDDAGGDKKINKENLKKFSFKEELAELPSTEKETGENREKLSKEEIIKLREKIEKTDLDENLKIQALAQAQNIKSLDNEEKIKKLLEIARKKGIIYAVSVAKKMNSPYILDIFHDKLAEEGFYKKFIK